MEYGNDPSIDAAAAKLMGRFTGAPSEAGSADTDTKKRAPELREPPKSADPLDDVDINGYEPNQELVEGEEAPAEIEAEGEEAKDSQEEYFELPPESEGAEAERIPRAQAIEAVRQMRQLNSGIAEAITKAEIEYHQKQDQAWSNMVEAHNAIIDRAEAALAAIPRPMMPPRSMLDEQSPNYDPQRYHALLNYYEDQVAVLRRTQAEKQQAEEGRKAVMAQALQETAQREHERMARHLPDWKDEAKRAEISKGVYGFLEKTYGLTPDFLNASIPFDHRIIRAMLDLKAMKEAQTKAPEVRKVVKETAPKLDNRGRVVSQDRAPNGQFVSEAKKRLRAEGSEEAFANKLLMSGALRNL